MRKHIPIDIRSIVLHESGYMCGNPNCRALITLDLHHVTPVSKAGPDKADNLIAICPNCHRRFHNGDIPEASLRAWKYTLTALNEAYDKRSIDVLFALQRIPRLFVKGDALIHIAALIASDMVSAVEDVDVIVTGIRKGGGLESSAERGYMVTITDKGRSILQAWKDGTSVSLS